MNLPASGGRMSTGGRLRLSSETAHNIHHKIAWKAINVGTKHVIFRCDGICKDDPKYNVHTLGDPRNPLTRFRNVESIDLPVPSFVLDNNSVGPQPKREVSIFGLNDNINHTFLTDMCQKTGQVIEAFVYMHPRTKKHLGMAYVVFQEAGKAESFVAKNNGTSVMGQTITCIVDPYAKEISRRYEERAVETAPVPHYLSRLDHDRLAEFRRISSPSASEYKSIPRSPSYSTSAQQCNDFKTTEPLPRKQSDEAEVTFYHEKDRQIHQQSVEAALTKITHSDNIIPSGERSAASSLAGHFAPLTLFPSITSSSSLPSTTVQTAQQLFCSGHYMPHQQSHAPFNYHSIPPNVISPLLNLPQVPSPVNIFPPAPTIPPINRQIPFPAWPSMPLLQPRTPANTWPKEKSMPSQLFSMGSSAQTTSAAYHAVPSTSSYEEVAPMDPAPSKACEEKKKSKTTNRNSRRRKRSVLAKEKIKVKKRKRLISVSSATGSSSPESNDGSESSKKSSQDSYSSGKSKYRNFKKEIIEERKRRKGANEIDDYCKSPELVEKVENCHGMWKRKEWKRGATELDEHFVEPDVDLPDLESVGSDEGQFSMQQPGLNVQSAAKKSSCTPQQQSKHVDWRKKRIMEKRRKQRDHRSCEDEESSSLSENEKGHRWSSSSSTTESETGSDEVTSFRDNKRTRESLSSPRPSKSSTLVTGISNTSDMVEAVTSSSEEWHGKKARTSDIARQPTSVNVRSYLTRNEPAQSLPTPSFVTSPEKVSSDSPLPSVMQSTPPSEYSRPSFERRLENLFRSTSVQPPMVETHEDERSNDGGNSVSPALDMSFLPANATPNAEDLEGLPLSQAYRTDHISAKVSVAIELSDSNSGEFSSWPNSEPQIAAKSLGRTAASQNKLDRIVEERMKGEDGSKKNKEQKEREEKLLEKKRAARENYVHAVYVAIREDLKNVLLKDLMHKVESIAFEKLEHSWNERGKAKVLEQDDDCIQSITKDGVTTKAILTDDKTSVPSPKQTVSSKDSLNEVVRQVTEQTRAEMSAAFGPDTAALLGTGLFFKGLGIARNMPSFKKKQIHLSPKRKQRSRSRSSSRSLCSTYYRARSESTPDSSRSCRSKSQNRSGSESRLTEGRSSDNEDERSTSGSEFVCSTSRSSQTFSNRKDFGSGISTPTDEPTSENDEEEEMDEEEDDDDEEDDEEQLERGEHIEKDCDEIEALDNLSARSGIEEETVLFVKTETDENDERDGIGSLSSCTGISHFIEQGKMIEKLQTKHEKVLGIANMEGYFNDHCYLPVELSEQLKKEFEENILTCSDSKRISSKYCETQKLEELEKMPLQHVQDKAAKVKKRSYRSELASLLPPPVNVEQFAWETGWKPAKQWEKRTSEEERVIFWKFEKEGLDEEDLMFLEKAFHEMQNDGTATWSKKLYWVPPRKVPEVHLLDKPKKIGKNIYYYDDPELEGVVPHSSGCARTEGYYKLSHKEKRGVLRRPDVFLAEINEKDDEKARYLIQSTREARSMNRRLLTSMGDTSSDIFKVNQLKFRKKLIKFARSRIHGWGLYALEAIAPDEMIVEYIGQKIRPTVADEREKRYERRGMGSSYLFRIDSDNVIDATQMGNLARFINHSCQPNCYAKIVVVDGEKRIVIYSKLAINKGDEITYDYKFPIEEDKIDCLCGAPGCRGSLN